jgi:FemAB-related protein (PEP-CTERM system-associated)
MISCKSLSWDDRARWDAFVAAHPHGTPFHLTAWRDTLQACFDYEPKYRVAIDERDRIVGVLPLFLIDNFITGRVLISTPFAVYGGILAADEAAHDALRDHAAAMAQRLHVQYLELRNGCDDQHSGLANVDRYATFTKAVAPMTPDELLASIPQKTRNLIRKALKHDYRTRPAADLTTFYRLLTQTYRRHGTPVFPLRFFEAILANFRNKVDVREVLLDGKVVAASMNFLFKDEMHTYYAASAPEALAAAPNNYMYFDHLLWAGNNGFKRFDFGRSKVDTGPYQFKKHFGADIRPLPYEVMLVKRQDMPNFTPKNPKFAVAARVWQHIPLPMTRILGPALISLFP